MTSKCKRYCSVPQCNQYKDRSTTIHLFPNDVKLRKVWQNILKIGKPISKYMSVCSRHFLETDYKGKWNPHSKKNHLRPDAIPSQNLPVTFHDHEKPVIDRSKRKRLTTKNSDTACTSMDISNHSNFIEMDHSYASTYNASTEHMRSANSDNSRIIAEGLSRSTQELLHYQEPENNIVEMIDKETQCIITSSFEQLLDTEKKCISFTGVGNNVIDTCVICINEIITENKGQYIPELRKKILLVLIKLKLNISFACLAVMFDVSPSSCTRYFYTVLHLLSLALEPVVYWPTKDAILANMPKCFHRYKNTRVILDCTEIKVQKCKCLQCRIRTYSHYKGTHTFKILIGVTPAGTISFVSKAFGGRATDKAIFLKEDVLSKCDPHDAIMVDKGFMIENECAESHVKLIRPPFLKKKEQFSKQEAEQTADIARARVHVERAIQRIKLFNILNDQIEWFIIPHINDVINVICALVNLSPPILSENKFEDCINECVSENISLLDSNLTAS